MKQFFLGFLVIIMTVATADRALAGGFHGHVGTCGGYGGTGFYHPIPVPVVFRFGYNNDNDYYNNDRYYDRSYYSNNYNYRNRPATVIINDPTPVYTTTTDPVEQVVVTTTTNTPCTKTQYLKDDYGNYLLDGNRNYITRTVPCDYPSYSGK